MLVALARTSAATLHVNAASTNAVPPFTNWATAAANIQDAVDAAAPGDEIVVTNGVYQTGARAVYGMNTRVAVNRVVTVRSVNGPAVTSIVGSGWNSPELARCVYLTNGAVLSGFTLTNGAAAGGWYTNSCGGGAWCEGPDAVLSNCVVTGCWSYDDGGGVFSGTLNNCVLTGNDGFHGGGAFSSTLNGCTVEGNRGETGGGVHSSTLKNCTLSANRAWDGGGAALSTLSNCTLTGNRLGDGGTGVGGGALECILINCTLTQNRGEHGGGAAHCTLTNCILVGNLATSVWTDSNYGGGSAWSTLDNCTLTGNSAQGEFARGDGVYSSTLNNCIVYYNGDNYYGSTLNYSCTTPNPASGIGNITNAPLFVNANGWNNLRLQSNSPCINAGYNAYVTAGTDLDSLPRIAGGTVDIGAYEFQSPASTISHAWLQQFALPTDGSADGVDTDHDGHNNWQEWRAGTDPTNALSVLRLASPVITPTHVTLTWTSVANRTYTLEQATTLGGTPAFSVLRSNLAGLPGTTSWTDTNAPISIPRFYQLRVSP